MFWSSRTRGVALSTSPNPAIAAQEPAIARCSRLVQAPPKIATCDGPVVHALPRHKNVLVDYLVPKR